MIEPTIPDVANENTRKGKSPHLPELVQDILEGLVYPSRS